jgi:hypothetical protein
MTRETWPIASSETFTLTEAQASLAYSLARIELQAAERERDSISRTIRPNMAAMRLASLRVSAARSLVDALEYGQDGSLYGDDINETAPIIDKLESYGDGMDPPDPDDFYRDDYTEGGQS